MQTGYFCRHLRVGIVAMKHLLAFLAGLLITAPIIGATVAGRTITLDDEDVADCRAGGGCVLMTREKMHALEALDCRGKS